MGKTQENLITCQNGQNPQLQYHLQLKTKEKVGDPGLKLERGGSKAHGDRKQMFGK